MFTLEQLATAHSKVRSGADFPGYIREIKALGVTHYEAYVQDGHIDYHGENGYALTKAARYDPLEISDNLETEEFKANLLAHQQGKTDYLTFIRMCADTGIEKWEIRMSEMTCTYFDKTGSEVLVEQIPH